MNRNIIFGIITGLMLSFSVNAEQLILDDLIVSGVSDGTALAYNCSAGATLPFPDFVLDSSSVTDTIPAGEPIIRVKPVFATCDTSVNPFICEYTCDTGGGHVCVGYDCVNGEQFDGNTLVLKENNLRIRFHDTSITDALGQSWNVEANASSNGGRSYFGFQLKSVTPDTLRVSDGTSPAYNCADLAVTKYPTNNLPSTGTIPEGEPVILAQPDLPSCTFISGAFQCLHICEEDTTLVYSQRSVLTLGTASGNPSLTDGVAIGYESAVEDGAVSVGRAALARRIAHVAAGISATDALTLEGLQGYSLLAQQKARAVLLAQQIADANTQLDEIETLIFPLTLLEALSEQPPVLPSGEIIDTSRNGDMKGPRESVNLQRLSVFRDTLERAIHFADTDVAAT